MKLEDGFEPGEKRRLLLEIRAREARRRRDIDRRLYQKDLRFDGVRKELFGTSKGNRAA